MDQAAAVEHVWSASTPDVGIAEPGAGPGNRRRRDRVACLLCALTERPAFGGDRVGKLARTLGGVRLRVCLLELQHGRADFGELASLGAQRQLHRARGPAGTRLKGGDLAGDGGVASVERLSVGHRRGRRSGVTGFVADYRARQVIAVIASTGSSPESRVASRTGSPPLS